MTRKKIYADETGRTPKQATPKRTVKKYVESEFVRRYREEREKVLNQTR